MKRSSACFRLRSLVAWGVLGISVTLACPALTWAQNGASALATAGWKWPGIADTDAARAALSRPEVQALQLEMTRAMNRLRLPSRQPPYYLAYTLLDVEQKLAVGQLGAVVQSDEQHTRSLHVEVRVGTPQLDNSHPLQGGDGVGFETSTVSVPLDSDVLALRTATWAATDQAYRDAIAALEQKSAARDSAVDYEARANDFSPHSPQVWVQPEPAALPSERDLGDIAKQVSLVFQGFPDVDESAVTVAAWRLSRTLLTSEGSLVVTPTQVIEVTIECSTQAEDGMPLSHRQTVFGELDVAKLSAQAQLLGAQLSELRRAPLAPDYYGPVLFSGQAGPQVVQELLGQSMVGTPVPMEGPLARKLHRRVLPTAFNLIDDPTSAVFGGQPLLGSYSVDDEGVRAKRVELVNRGMLETLLMSRTPSREIAKSNGHGRTGHAGWARGSIGNLILTTSRPRSLDSLRATLVKAGEAAIEIERLAPREFSSNGASPPDVERAFLVTPDGKRSLVRGVTLGEMQVRDMKDLVAGSNQPVVYSTLLASGAYSIPASIVAPALLFEEVEIKKPKRSPQRPKVLARPNGSAAGRVPE